MLESLEDKLLRLQKEGREAAEKAGRENAERLLPEVLAILEEQAKRGEYLSLSIWPPCPEIKKAANTIHGETLYLDVETQDSLVRLLTKNFPNHSINDYWSHITLYPKRKDLHFLYYLLGIFLLIGVIFSYVYSH